MTSQTNLKRNVELASSSDSSTSGRSTLSASAEEKKKIRRKRPPLQPTAEHLQIRAVVDAGEKWELDLEQVHGLTDEEACVVVSIANKHLSQDEFPPSNGNRFVELAHQGWKGLKELRQLKKLYPHFNNQAKVDGVWRMFHW